MSPTGIRRTAFHKTLAPEIVRAQRRFRQHVQTLRNPRGVIVRLPCRACLIAEARDKPSEAHHLDYLLAFLVVWLCESCHRKVEHGSLRVKKIWITDYSSLVAARVRPRGWVEHAGRNLFVPDHHSTEEGDATWPAELISV